MISLLFVPESCGEGGKQKLDLPGAFLITLGLGLVVFGMIEAPARGWTNPETWGTSVAGVIAIGLFLWREATTDNPLLPLRLFQSRNFTGANLLTLLLYAALGALLFFLPYNLIQVQGYHADTSRRSQSAAYLDLVLSFPMGWRTGCALWRKDSRW